ncbi:MAG: hypothetical protein M3Y85_09725 [Bacteroidota bacterium]|nr:hypothetical protein [Bacteroidota bacterium]
MKKIFYLLIFSFSIHAAFAQDEQPGATRLREKMVEYIQDKLGLGKDEAEKFQPVFLDYFKELHKTNKEFAGDRLVLQQKIIEVRLRYREQFKPIIGEKRSNDVFTYERDFVQKVKDLRDERRQEHPEGRADKRKNTELLPN